MQVLGSRSALALFNNLRQQTKEPERQESTFCLMGHEHFFLAPRQVSTFCQKYVSLFPQVERQRPTSCLLVHCQERKKLNKTICCEGKTAVTRHKNKSSHLHSITLHISVAVRYVERGKEAEISPSSSPPPPPLPPSLSVVQTQLRSGHKHLLKQNGV